MSRAKLSVVIIAFNESENIADCLQSVKWADEIIVVDSGSTDGTVEMARAAGASVISTDWPGYGVQKNRAIAYATGDWILSLDADERVTPALRLEIESVLDHPATPVQAFELPRLSSFCGHWMRHGGWWPDHVARLFRAGSARFSDAIVHEHLVVEGRLGRLREPLLHYTYRTLEQALFKMDNYSTLGALKMYNAGRRTTPRKAISRGISTFFKCYFLQLGFLDGWAGLVFANYRAQGFYYRYLKLWKLGCVSALATDSGNTRPVLPNPGPLIVRARPLARDLRTVDQQSPHSGLAKSSDQVV
ncbi:MAG: glycosyltransferase family 2 protein [Nevskia sp.]|nr:glycosyltransferase family 2 protein [Nevskia sp.]